MKIKSIIILLFFAGIAPSALSQHMQAVRTNGTIRVDGHLTDAAWDQAEVYSSFYQYEPELGAPPSFHTDVLVLYSSRAIYFGLVCFDTDARNIAAKITKRDGEISADDMVAIMLDTYNNQNTGYIFTVNPLGTQLDGRIADNGRTMDTKWDATWKSACVISDSGWTAEIAIPFSSIRYKAGGEVWGINIGRYIPRLRERLFSTGGLTGFHHVSQFSELRGLDLRSFSNKRLELIPYVQAQFKEDEKTETNAGLDVRFRPVSNFSIEGTVNPDFATVEGDVEQVNMTRFELSYPEKRPFFMEGNEHYSTRIRQFYSRRIGDISWGGKVSGNAGKWQVNGLVTQSDPATAGADVEKGETATYTVFRVNREIAGGSTVGLIGANRTYRNENSGSMGLVGTLFFTDVLGMTTQFIKSHGPASGGTWTYFIRPAYDSQLMHFHVRYSHYGTGVKENMNDIGFIRHDDRKEFDTNFSRTFWINRYGIDSFQASVNYNRYWSQENVLRSDELRTSLEFGLFKKWSLELDYDTDFKAEYAPYFEKDFRNRELGIDLGYDSKKGFAASMEVVTGVNYDQNFEEIEGSVELSPVKGWNVEYQFSKYWFSPGDPDEQEWIHYIRTSYYFHKDMYVKLFYQTRNLYTDPWDVSTFEQVRKTLQIAYVWRFLPPFGSIQLAYQEGTTRHTEEEGAGRTFFTKLSWMF